MKRGEKIYDPPHPAVVVWEDVHNLEEPHHSVSTLDLTDKVEFTHRCYIIAELPDAIWLCAAVGPDGAVSDVNRIPRGCVKSIYWEKVPE